jgi:uncharacterized protein
VLGELLAGCEGREEDAAAACRAAIAAGFPEANDKLGEILCQLPGHEAEAERALRASIAAYGGTDFYPFLLLGQLLETIEGREREAAEAYRRAIAAGYPRASTDLGSCYERIGDDDNAERAFVAGAAAGDSYASSRLAQLLARLPSRRADAEAAFRAAIAAGHGEDYLGLGALLERWPGREEQAGDAYRNAIEAGHLLDGHVALARWHAARGRLTEAERILRREADLDQPDAWLHLGDVLADAGHHDTAEAAFRAAINAGQPAGHAHLARLLANDPQRRDEAERNRTIAFAAGHTSAQTLEQLPTATITATITL